MSAIYLVEDDDEVRMATALLLCAGGWTVTAFPTAAGCLEALGCCKRPMCIVTDLLMPGLDGVDLVRALQAEDRQVPVVLYTACDRHSVRVSQAVDAGAAAVVQKPAGGEELDRAIRKAIAPEMRQTAGSSGLEARAGIEPTYGDLQSPA